MAALANGLVLRRRDGTLRSYDTERRRVAPGLGLPGDVLGVHGPLVAWVSHPSGDCLNACALHLTDLASGGDEVVDPPAGLVWIRGGAISPDGTRLAAFATPPHHHDAPAERARLVVVDIATKGAIVVTGSDVPLGDPEVAARWSATSGWLFYSGLGASVRAWFPGAASTIALPVPGTYAFAVT